MATKDELKEIAQVMRLAAHNDPTYEKVKFEMVRLANKIEVLTPRMAINIPVNGGESIAKE